MKRTILTAAALALLTTSPAAAFSWQQFWTGAPTPEDSALYARCGTLTVGFLKAAPCMSEFLHWRSDRWSDMTLARADLDLAQRIDQLAAMVNARTMTEARAFAELEPARVQHGKIGRAVQDGRRIEQFTNDMQRQFELQDLKRCLRPNASWC